MRVWRVLYASGRWETVHGDDQLRHVRSRSSPRVLHWLEAPTYRCQVCEVEGPWDEGWIAWTRYNERYKARGQGDDIYCSAACCRAENPERQPSHWMAVDSEPLPAEVRQRIYELKREEEDRRRRLRNHRKVPMPEWRGRGFCKWCNEPMRKGERATMWHPECSRLYLIATDHNRARQALRERDGTDCQWPGCTDQGFDVDHKTPLWSVDQSLPLDQLREFYLLGNLWCLCGPHHAAKTKREAGDRARARRLDKAQLPLI